MTLSMSEKERYSRQTKALALGLRGQERIKKASVCVIGAGGLGSTALAYLAAAGVGRIGFADSGDLELSNLNRQVFYKTKDVGRAKAALAASCLKELNPEVKIEPHKMHISASNIKRLIEKYDLVLDCADNFDTRFEINRACFESGRPYIYGAVYSMEGQVAVIDPRRGPCLRCAFAHVPPPVEGPLPVFGPVAGVIGAMQALEALKLLAGIKTHKGRMLLADLSSGVFHHISVKKRKRCPVCGYK